MGSFESTAKTGSFGQGDYSKLLRTLSVMGYRDVGLDELEESMPHMFLRHDVDVCPVRAVQMSRIEAELGFRSTYYFLVSTDFYNLSSANNRKILREVVSSGHRVGLHFDVTAYRDDFGDLELFAERECQLLEQLSESEVRSISFHRPSKDWLNRKGAFAGRRHTYEPCFFGTIGYISDSNGGWHHGHPFESPAVQERRAIQLLTHPIWWCNPEELDVSATLARFKADRISQIELDLRATVTAYGQRRDS